MCQSLNSSSVTDRDSGTATWITSWRQHSRLSVSSRASSSHMTLFVNGRSASSSAFSCSLRTCSPNFLKDRASYGTRHRSTTFAHTRKKVTLNTPSIICTELAASAASRSSALGQSTRRPQGVHARWRQVAGTILSRITSDIPTGASSSL